MTALERKQNSEQQLTSLGIHLTHELPPIEEEQAITPRTSREIAERILILTYLNCIHSDNSLRQEVVAFLKDEGLFEKATPAEKDLFLKDEFSDDEATNIAWRGESIWMLLWAIQKVDTLSLPVDEVDLGALFALLPPFLQSTNDFVNASAARSKSEILDQADLIFRLFWSVQQAESPNPAGLNPGVTFERYYAINWVMGVRGEWDDV
jgi:hypothetical protein